MCWTSNPCEKSKCTNICRVHKCHNWSTCYLEIKGTINPCGEFILHESRKCTLVVEEKEENVKPDLFWTPPNKSCILRKTDIISYSGDYSKDKTSYVRVLYKSNNGLTDYVFVYGGPITIQKCFNELYEIVINNNKE